MIKGDIPEITGDMGGDKGLKLKLWNKKGKTGIEVSEESCRNDESRREFFRS